jgi:two-component system, LytTR family, sensor kinase
MSMTRGKTSAETHAENRMREIALRRRVERQAEFFRHLAMYVAVCGTLWAANLWQIREGGFMQTNKWWAFIPTVAWGFGVLTHGISVLLSSLRRTPFVSVDWEERKVRELMNNDRKAGTQ